MWALLALAKASRCAVLFAASDVLVPTGVPISVFLLCVLGGTAVLLLTLMPARRKGQPPMNASRHGGRIAAHSAGLVLTLWLWCFGLKHCGPVRTILIDASEVGVVSLLGLALGVRGAHGRRLGLALLFLAYLLLLGTHGSHPHRAGPTRPARASLPLEPPSYPPTPALEPSWPDHALGEAALVAAAALTAVRKGASRGLARDLGGPMRLFALSTALVRGAHSLERLRIHATRPRTRVGETARASLGRASCCCCRSPRSCATTLRTASATT